MTFLAAERLWLLALLPVLAAGYVVLQRRRRHYAVRFTNLALLDRVAPRRPQWRRHVAVVLALVSMAVVVVAFARPQAEVRVPRERATIVITIDVSLSMMAEDVQPSRFAAAKAAATNFVGVLPAKFNLALVAFAGTANVVVSPTTDHEVVARAIDNLQLAESTAIGEALFTSLEALEQVPRDPDHPRRPPPARIVLLSDGKTTSGRATTEGAEAVAQARVPVHTIAFGTEGGYITYHGYTSPVPVDQEELRAVAETTLGRAYTAASADQLNRVYADIGSSVGYIRQDREVTSWFVGIALLTSLGAAVAAVLLASRFP